MTVTAELNGRRHLGDPGFVMQSDAAFAAGVITGNELRELIALNGRVTRSRRNPITAKAVEVGRVLGGGVTDLRTVRPIGPTNATTNGRGELRTRELSSYQIRRVEWLDKPFLQSSAFHLLAGRKGSAKGTYSCGLAARVTTGNLYDRPKRVLVVTSEDSVELDFLPRFVAAGGDPALVRIVNAPFRLPEDLPQLEQSARSFGNVGLILLDPIGNHLGGVDTDREGLVREAIQGLNPLSDKLACIILGVRHLGKDVSRGALASVLGSTAWVDVPRCVILMARDDEDETLFHYQVVAGNRGPLSQARAFRLDLVDVPPAKEITLAVEQGSSAKDVEDLLNRRGGESSPSRSTQARELILDILNNEGAQESDTLDARVAAETGLAARTIRNVRRTLREEGLIASEPDKDERGQVVRWLISRIITIGPTA